ncbi:glycosyltransferase [Streptomyces yaizuensis]|uniref:Galactosyltransferase-related protein n=1 Tax=Streptomyces yaizuensis TaxID=2989713 RepID=A0ABQ5P5K6_9ACTN|nr:galactosyltransferase-related protein [Streptomyces sp. YSPA8]GLF97748.1 galactosyltransferase-related protein [Streptomyces sp. YSPA8]
MTTARPHYPPALADAAVSSLLLTLDPLARAVAPDYWDWSRDAHHALADALMEVTDPALGDLVDRVRKDPYDSAACRALATELAGSIGADAPRTASVARLAEEVEVLSRLLVHPGHDDGTPVEPATAQELFRVAAHHRPAHRRPGPVDAAVVIPFRAGDGDEDRVRNLAAVLAALADQSHPRERYRVVVVESDVRPRRRDVIEPACDSYVFAPCPGRFNKSWTVNVGVVHGARPAELVCVLDGDILVDRDFVARAVNRFREPGTQAHWPFSDILFLDPVSSHRSVRRRCLDGAARVDPASARGVYLRRPPGGCVWLRESLFTRIGGMDERFAGWGGEDQDFVWRMERYGPMDRHHDPVVHLHHPRAPHREPDGTPFYEDVEQAGFCSWPTDARFGDLDKYRGAEERGVLAEEVYAPAHASD